MNVVIYSDDLEPITVLDLPVDLLNKAAEDGAIKLRIKAKGTTYGEDQTCTLQHKELLTDDGYIVSVLVTTDESEVMLAKPGWLPGQRGQLNYYLKKIQTLLGQRRDR